MFARDSSELPRLHRSQPTHQESRALFLQRWLAAAATSVEARGSAVDSAGKHWIRRTDVARERRVLSVPPSEVTELIGRVRAPARERYSSIPRKGRLSCSKTVPFFSKTRPGAPAALACSRSATILVLLLRFFCLLPCSSSSSVYQLILFTLGPPPPPPPPHPGRRQVAPPTVLFPPGALQSQRPSEKLRRWQAVKDALQQWMLEHKLTIRQLFDLFDTGAFAASAQEKKRPS